MSATAALLTPGTASSDDANGGALLLDAGTVARLLSVSRATVWRMRDAGKLPQPVRLGGAVRWRRADIDAWVRAGCPSRGPVRG
jgi:excisionase family DNA binding protein